MTGAITIALVLAAETGISGGIRAQAPPAAPPGTAATVNGETITLDAWTARMQRLRPQDFGTGQPGQYRDTTAGQVALEQLIGTRLLMQYAAKTSLLPADKEVDAAVAAARKQPATAAALESGLLSEQQVREDALVQLTVFNVATINERVTPEEVEACYLTQFVPQERWHLAGIQVTGSAAADRVAAEIKKGTDFGALARQLSEDQRSKGRGGDLGTVPVNDAGMSQLIRDAVTRLKVGDVSPALLAGSGAGGQSVYLFMKLLGREPAPAAAPLEQIRPQVERAALLKKVGGPAAAQRKVDEARKSATIKVYLRGYEGLSSAPR